MKHLLLRLPFVNILYFALFPKMAYTEYLRWVMETEGVKLEDLWKLLTPKQKQTLSEFGMFPEYNNTPPLEDKISTDIKEQ